MDALSPVATILLFEKFQKCFFFMLPFASSFKIFINVFTFLYVRANSKEIGEEILFPSFFRKMLMPAFLQNARLPPFFFLDSNSFCKDLPFPHGANLAQKLPY